MKKLQYRRGTIFYFSDDMHWWGYQEDFIGKTWYYINTFKKKHKPVSKENFFRYMYLWGHISKEEMIMELL